MSNEMLVPGVDREEFRQLLVHASSDCELQHDGWPCGSCCYTREPEDWTAILAFRGDYNEERRIADDGSVSYEMCVRIVFDDDGKFLRHEFKLFLEGELAARIQRLYGELKG